MGGGDAGGPGRHRRSALLCFGEYLAAGGGFRSAPSRPEEAATILRAWECEMSGAVLMRVCVACVPGSKKHGSTFFVVSGRLRLPRQLELATPQPRPFSRMPHPDGALHVMSARNAVSPPPADADRASDGAHAVRRVPCGSWRRRGDRAGRGAARLRQGSVACRARAVGGLADPVSRRRTAVSCLTKPLSFAAAGRWLGGVRRPAEAPGAEKTPK